MEDIRDLGVNDLVRRLHESVSGFVVGMENVIGINSEVLPSEIADLRRHITERLKRGEEITDNKRLISLLTLLSKDQAVLELVRDDAKDWLEIIEAVEKQISSRKPLSSTDRKEIEKIKLMSVGLKSLIRNNS